MTQLGIISDTHGLLRPEALDLLKRVDLIFHAGDVGSENVLEQLSRISPVYAVKGNVDVEPWALGLPELIQVEVDGLRILVIHNIADLSLHSNASKADTVLFGHSHKPSCTLTERQTCLNPGSAGRQRFRLPVSLVLAYVSRGSLVPTFIDLLTGQPFVPAGCHL